MPSCSSLLVPTSDLEEEWRSESEEERPDHGGGQIVSIQVEVEETVRLVHLHVSREGVRLVSDLAGLESVWRATTVPISFSSQTAQGRSGEKKAVADLAVSQLAARSLSPVVLTPLADRSVSPDRSAVKLKRQLTFVETELCQAESQTERTELAPVETQTERREESEAGSQTDWRRDESQAASQTLPVAQAQSATQTEPLPAQEELLTDTFPPSRSPRYPLTFSSTQTTPPNSPPSTTHMTSQTSPKVSSRTRESSPASGRVATTGVSEAAADEMVARVLLEHAGAGSDSESRQSLTTPASSSSTISQASGSLFSVESGRATSYDNVTNRQDPGGKDLSRTVNYLDLSRLGNEGETPNSDEIWVTVEDDNKFLTSDTETYSVATDKVSEHSVLSTVNCVKCKVGRSLTANLLQITTKF